MKADNILLGKDCHAGPMSKFNPNTLAMVPGQFDGSVLVCVGRGGGWDGMGA